MLVEASLPDSGTQKEQRKVFIIDTAILRKSLVTLYFYLEKSANRLRTPQARMHCFNANICTFYMRLGLKVQLFPITSVTFRSVMHTVLSSDEWTKATPTRLHSDQLAVFGYSAKCQKGEYKYVQTLIITDTTDYTVLFDKVPMTVQKLLPDLVSDALYREILEENMHLYFDTKPAGEKDAEAPPDSKLMTLQVSLKKAFSAMKSLSMQYKLILIYRAINQKLEAKYRSCGPPNPDTVFAELKTMLKRYIPKMVIDKMYSPKKSWRICALPAFKGELCMPGDLLMMLFDEASTVYPLISNIIPRGCIILAIRSVVIRPEENNELLILYGRVASPASSNLAWDDFYPLKDLEDLCLDVQVSPDEHEYISIQSQDKRYTPEIWAFLKLKLEKATRDQRRDFIDRTMFRQTA